MPDLDAHGPYLLTTVGDTIQGPLRFMGVVWVASSTAGDQAELRDPVNGNLLWSGRAFDTNTYQGISFGGKFVAAPNGLRLTSLSSGKILVYPAED